MLSYVVSSMKEGAEFNFMSGVIVSVGVTILIFIASAILPNDKTAQH